MLCLQLTLFCLALNLESCLVGWTQAPVLLLQWLVSLCCLSVKPFPATYTGTSATSSICPLPIHDGFSSSIAFCCLRYSLSMLSPFLMISRILVDVHCFPLSALCTGKREADINLYISGFSSFYYTSRISDDWLGIGVGGSDLVFSHSGCLFRTGIHIHSYTYAS